MPELPDVEAVVRMLRRRVVGGRIERVRILDHAVVRSPTASAFVRRLRGRVIQRVYRRGKYLLLSLGRGTTVVGHLRMTGDLIVVPRDSPIQRHTRLVIGLDGKDIRFVDPRRFGHVDLVATHALSSFEGLRDLGVEPLSSAFTQELLQDFVRARRGSLKAFLLRQNLVAGVGNIYADEILFQARLRPDRRTGSLRASEVRRLHQAIRSALRRGIEASSGHGGVAGDLVDVRVRDGTCPRGHRGLRTVSVGGRTSYFCPRCQG